MTVTVAWVLRTSIPPLLVSPTSSHRSVLPPLSGKLLSQVRFPTFIPLLMTFPSSYTALSPVRHGSREEFLTKPKSTRLGRDSKAGVGLPGITH